MFTNKQLKGMWVSVPTEWDEDDNFDEESFRDVTAKLIDVGAHGLYTTGSTGEFYALDWEEYKQVTDAFLAETQGRVPVQIGANWFNTRDTIRRVRYARDKGTDGVQICFPGWMSMPVDHYDQFFVDIYQAVPDISLVHYNTARTKKQFYGLDYARVASQVPTLVATKACLSVNEFLTLVTYAPQMCHYAGELDFALCHQLGATGMITSWFMMNPDFFHNYYRMCTEGRYSEAIAVAKRLTKWFTEAVLPLFQKGYMDPTLDKAFIAMAGWLGGNRRTRRPYIGLTEEECSQLRRVTERIMPEFLSYKN